MNTLKQLGVDKEYEVIDPLLAEVVKARYRDLLQEAEIRRLTREPSPARPKVRARVLVRVADLMIVFGQAVKARYQPVTY